MMFSLCQQASVSLCHVTVIVTLTMSCHQVTAECGIETDCSIKDTIPCTVRMSAFCVNKIGEFSRSAGEITWAGQPRGFTARAVERGCGERNVSGILFRWKPPVNANPNALKGFLLRVSPLNQIGGHTICRLFDLRNTSWSIPDLDESFSYTLFPVPDRTKFAATFASLPLPEVQHQAAMTHHVIVSTPRRGASAWTTEIDWYLDSSADLIVTFDLAPVTYNFPRYDVILLDQITQEGIHNVLVDNRTNSSTTQKLQTVFNNVSSGEYELLVRPIGGECGNDCITSRVSLETEHPPIEPVHQHLSDISTSGSDKGVIVAGVTLGVAVLVAAFLLLVYFRRRKEAEHSCDIKAIFCPVELWRRHTKVAKIPSPIQRKTVFLIYSYDHDAFLSLVSAFACYLQTYCFVDVLHIDWCFGDLRSWGIQSWIRTSLDRADVIVNIHSKGGAKQYMAFQNGLRYKSAVASLKSSLFVLALSELQPSKSLQQKSIDVTFQANAETHDSFGNEEEMRVLTLMREFRELVKKIHNLQENANYDLPLNSDHCGTDEGRQLLRSISNCNECDESDPTWPDRNFPDSETVEDLDLVSNMEIVSCEDECPFLPPDLVDDDISIGEQLRIINMT